MKKILLLFCLLSFSFAGFAQSGANRIVTKSGDVIHCSDVFSVIPYTKMGYHVGDTEGEPTVYIDKRDIEYIYMGAEDKNYYFDSNGRLVELRRGVREHTPGLKGRTRFNIGLGITMNPDIPIKNGFSKKNIKAGFFASGGFAHYLNDKLGVGATALFKTASKSPEFDRSIQSIFIGPSLSGSLFSKKNNTYLHLELAIGYSVTQFGDGNVELYRGIGQTNRYGAVSLAIGSEFLVSPKTGIEISLRYTVDVISTQQTEYDKQYFKDGSTSILDYMHGFNGLSIIAGLRF